MRMNLCEHNDQSHTIIPRIGLIVTSVFTSVQQRTWDMGVAASIGSLTINDHYKRKGTSVKSQHLLTCRSAPGKETEKQTFLSVKYTQVIGAYIYLYRFIVNCAPKFDYYPSSYQNGCTIYKCNVCVCGMILIDTALFSLLFRLTVLGLNSRACLPPLSRALTSICHCSDYSCTESLSLTSWP